MPPLPTGATPSDISDPDPRESRLTDLVRKYARLVRLAVRTVGGRRVANDAEDIEQRIYLSLWQQVKREQTIEYPASYVYKAAVRETVRAVRRLGVMPSGDGSGLSERPSERPDPERLAVDAETARILRESLAALPRDRARAVRAHLQGLSAAEIMSVYAWSYQKTRNLIARGMADLRTALRSRGVS